MALHPLTWRVDRFSGVREGRNATSKAGDVSQAAAVSDSRASLRMGMEHYPGTGPLARMKPLHLLNELHNGAQKLAGQGLAITGHWYLVLQESGKGPRIRGGTPLTQFRPYRYC